MLPSPEFYELLQGHHHLILIRLPSLAPAVDVDVAKVAIRGEDTLLESIEATDVMSTMVAPTTCQRSAGPSLIYLSGHNKCQLALLLVTPLH